MAMLKKLRASVGKAHHHHPAATDIPRSWLENRERKGDAHGGVHRVSASLQNLHAGL